MTQPNLNNPQPALKTDTLAMSMAMVLGLSLVQRGFGFVREILLCRWLDETQLGQWSMAFVFLMSAAAFVTLGIQGSMNRYVEQYRSQGRLRIYLCRVAIMSLLLAILGAIVLWWQGRWFANFIFGSEESVSLVWMLSVGLLVVVANHFLVDLFTALRLFRVVTVLQFCNGVGFVLLSLSLLILWKADAACLIAAFTLSMLFSGLLILFWQRKIFTQLPPDQSHVVMNSQWKNSLWSKLLLGGISLWVYDFLVNLFLATDRYMLLHFSGMDELEALAAVGNYHAARVLPLLLATFAGLIGATLMPHFSHAWEQGHQKQVAKHTALAVKLVGLGLTAVGCVILLFAPWIFEIAFDGKYGVGQSVLPGVLVYCIWYAVGAITINYLWCAEKLSLCGMSLAVGVVLNIVLNLVLLPIYGLWGAVIATVVANGVNIALVHFFSHRYGMHIDSGLVIIVLVPMVLMTSPIVAICTLALILTLAILSTAIFNREEQQIVLHYVTIIRQRVLQILAHRKTLRNMKA